MLSNCSPSINFKCQTKLPSLLGLIIQMKSCNQETVASFIDSVNNESINQVNSEIDYLIKLSIDYEHPDVTTFLLDYKYKNNLFESQEEKMKRLEL